MLNYFKKGYSALDYMRQSKENKKKYGRKVLVLADEEQTYILEQVAKGWTLDVIKGRAERPLLCSTRILYRLFEKGVFAPVNTTDERKEKTK